MYIYICIYIYIYIYIYVKARAAALGLPVEDPLLGACGEAELWLLWVSCCLTRRPSRISPESHQNFAGISPE